MIKVKDNILSELEAFLFFKKNVLWMFIVCLSFLEIHILKDLNSSKQSNI